jgi:hypothetical protein
MHPRTREILDYLDQQRAVLRAAFDAVPSSLRDRSPAPGRWSTSGVIEHVAMVEGRLARRLSTRITEARAEGVGPEQATEPVLPTLDVASVLHRTKRVTAPDTVQPTGLDAEAAWTALEHAGEELRETIRAGDGLALGTVLMPHPVFGSISVYHWFAFAVAHEARHAEQIREIAETLAPAGS